jgi:hypothetical protein
MAITRREFGRLTAAGLPAAAFIENPLFNSVFAQGKPNSKFGGVQIGVITYSYRSMPDQSAEATLKYVLESGVSAIELMDTPVELFLGRPAPVARAGGAGAAGGGRRGGAEAPAGPTPYEQLMAERCRHARPVKAAGVAAEVGEAERRRRPRNWRLSSGRRMSYGNGALPCRWTR